MLATLTRTQALTLTLAQALTLTLPPFKVHFAPREGQDYHCQLVCITERERFVIGLSVRD